MATTGDDNKSAFPQSMANIRQGSRPGRFALPKEESCIAPENVWSNKGEARALGEIDGAAQR